MPSTSNNNPSKTQLYLALIMLSATLLGLFMLTRDNGWGDDFAGYILQAKSVVDGNMDELISRNTFTIESSSYNINPANYPWGFPLMLAPAYALFGIKILAFKLVLLLCHALLLPVCFLLARTRLGNIEALMLAALVGFNSVLMAEGLGEVLSDIPFTLFSLTGLWMIVRPLPASRRGLVGRGLLTGLAIFLAAFVRTNGMLLLVPLIVLHGRSLFQPERARRRRAALSILLPGFTLGVLYLLQAIVFPHSSLRNVHMSLNPQDLWTMVQYYSILPAYFLLDFGPAASVLYAFQLILFAASLWAHAGRDLPFHAYTGAMLALLIAFPYAQGARYLYPVWPVFLLFTLDGVHVLASRMKPGPHGALVAAFRILWCGIIALSLVVCVGLARANMLRNRNAPARRWGAFSAASNEMFDFVRHHTPPDSVVIFFKPRAMRLRTNRDSFVATECSYLQRSDYLVTVEDGGSYDQIAPERVKFCDPNILLTPVYEKDLFIIYQIDARD